jgi:hypothetical protein
LSRASLEPATIRVSYAITWAYDIIKRDESVGGGIRTGRSANAKVDVNAVYVL